MRCLLDMKRFLLALVPTELRSYVKALALRIKFIKKFGINYYRLSNFKRVEAF